MWWQWLIFGLIFLAVPYGLYEIKKFATKRIKPTEEQNKIANQRFAILCLFYWLCDCFYMTFIINNLTLKFILGGLIMIIIFYSLSKAFISGNSPLKIGLVQDFIVGIALTIYLIYIIPNESLQQIIIPIVAAVYGGLLTLVGVAWTIKESDRDRKKEEEKKAIPVFTYNAVFNEPNIKTGIKTCFPIDVEENYFSDIYLEIENSEGAYFELMKVYHDKKWFGLQNNTVVLSKGKVMLSFRFNNSSDVFLAVKDRLMNIYYYWIEVVTLNHIDPKNGHEVFTIANLKPLSKEYVDEVQNKTEEKKDE